MMVKAVSGRVEVKRWKCWTTQPLRKLGVCAFQSGSITLSSARVAQLHLSGVKMAVSRHAGLTLFFSSGGLVT